MNQQFLLEACRPFSGTGTGSGTMIESYLEQLTVAIVPVPEPVPVPEKGLQACCRKGSVYER